jgi:hypothetical protein
MLGDTTVILSTENGQWGRFPEKGDLTAAAPLPKEYYDFAYTNEKYLTAAIGGYPLGDLNWFADKKTQWQNDSKKETYDAIIASVLDGSFKFESGVGIKNIMGANFYVRCQNPISSSAILTYSLPQASNVSIVLYDISGRKMSTIVANKNLNAGEHTATINAYGLLNGTYFCKITTGNGTYTQKIVKVD